MRNWRWASRGRESGIHPGIKSGTNFFGITLEPIIHAGAHHVHLDAGAVGQRGRAGGHNRIVDRAQIHVEIFEPCAPVRPERNFAAQPDGPAARRCVLRERGVHTAAGRGAFERYAPEGVAAGGISEPAVRGVTNPGARGAEPFDIMFDRGIGHRPADAALGTDAALRIGPVEIGFGPQDQRAGLPFVADLSAASRAKHGGVYGREWHAADAESTSVAREVDADIPTDIKTTPIAYGTIRRRRRVARRAGWCWRQ